MRRLARAQFSWRHGVERPDQNFLSRRHAQSSGSVRTACVKLAALIDVSIDGARSAVWRNSASRQ